MGAPSNGKHTLKDIRTNHTLTASFIATPPNTYQVTAKVEGGQGSVSPSEKEVTSGVVLFGRAYGQEAQSNHPGLTGHPSIGGEW